MGNAMFKVSANLGSIPQPLIKTIVVLYIQIVLDFMIMAFMMLLAGYGLVQVIDSGRDEDIFVLLFISLILVTMFFWSIFKLIVVLMLRRQKRWAQICAIVICALNCLNFPYIIFGIIGLVGLLNPTTSNWFKPTTPSEPLLPT